MSRTILFASLLLLTACSSSAPQIQYYLLPEVQPAFSSSAQKRLVLEPVQVASFLNTNALIYQQSEVELNPTRLHQWAEPLDQQLTRSLLAELSKLKPDYQLATEAVSAADLRLTVQVSQFQISSTGQVLLSARMHLLNGSELSQHSFSLSLPLAEDGYAVAVQTLGLGWQEMARQISDKL
ncbi:MULTISPECIES: PqiC family protein [Rheinheimera]|uniref:Membrane integrity-associated transporter subunit PqiC n=1 Tax=Rheinheimera marina TaxID=1774958 RepID=A0ABV9JNH5_9GAMM